MCIIVSYNTGAGKTYTMLGTPKNPGIMVLTLNDLFFQMKATESDVIYNVTMSYMEVSSIVCINYYYFNRFIMK